MIRAWERVAENNSNAFEMKCREHMAEMDVMEDIEEIICEEAPCKKGCPFVRCDNDCKPES